MAMFPVNPEKEEDLIRRMTAQGLREEDIEEKFVRSGGHGGQNVNKVATCVMLMHRPTKLQVKCQMTRRQGMNRYLARLQLLTKIEALQREKMETQRKLREKIRRQKQRRTQAAQKKILADKRRQSDKKHQRRRVTAED